jgi:hypothetical protein
MAAPMPRPLTPGEQRARRRRVVRIARRLGFVGRVEYRHIYSQTGGAQYGRGINEENDVLAIYMRKLSTATAAGTIFPWKP